MLLRLQIFFAVLFFCAVAPSAQAAHLIGGDISYTCLGNNVYTVKLRVYRDCAGGGAAFDNFVQVAIYDINSTLINTLSMQRGPITSVSNRFQADPCITVPPALCVEFSEYEDTITLPPVSGGYLLVHQRCCRNANISNVTSPGNIGNTYSINIPDMDTTCNSSAQFNGDIELISCVGFPIDIPVSITETDGDSISYQLCQIFEGAGNSGAGGNCGSVIPSPPCPPPYQAVTFQAPASFLNPIPSNPPFKIDSISGLLSGVPTVPGNYVLGICVSEWRNGQRLSTTRLDYQLAVTTCVKSVISDMVTQQERPQINCNGLSLEFESESVNASTLKWDFGDTTTTADTAVAGLTTYTFPSAGNYLVTLIANPGLPCSDTTQSVFRVSPDVSPDFRYDGVLCFEANEVDFEPIGFYPTNTTFNWNFGPDAIPNQVTTRSPVGITYSSPGVKLVELTVNWLSCEKTFTDTIFVNEYTVPIDAGPDTTINRNDVVTLTASQGLYFYWYANKPAEFNNRFSQSIEGKLLPDQDSVWFYVRVTDFQGCEGLDSLLVTVRPDDYQPVDNFISPNGDGFNDYFDLSLINPFNNCEFTVMNRWGATVYNIDQYQNDWDGNNQDGNPLPDGTYYWILQCGFEVQGTGPVTVLRNAQ